MQTLPEPFVRRMHTQLSDEEYTAFVAALATAPPVAVRLNRRKPSNAVTGADIVPWCAETGRYLVERPIFALDPLWHAGAYYVQEASSMLLNAALHAYAHLSQPGLRVLDLCAAPGGKSTLLADALGDDALLVTNETIKSRAPILRENILKWGWSNTVVTNADPQAFAPLAGFFDIVLIDAPCSGEGLFRKGAGAINEWSEANADLCAARQRRILQAVLPLVREGGLLLYSTCTFNPDENDGVVEWLIGQQAGYEPLPALSDFVPEVWGLVDTRYGVQCFPHRVRGEGFYLAALRQEGGKKTKRLPARAVSIRSAVAAGPDPRKAVVGFIDAERFELTVNESGLVTAIPKEIAEAVRSVTEALPPRAIVSAGLPVGTIKGRDFVPAYDLALSVDCAGEIPGVELSLTDALRYLRKESMDIFADLLPRGFVRATYQGLGLGWLKAIPAQERVNNYLPTEYRLRMTSTP